MNAWMIKLRVLLYLYFCLINLKLFFPCFMYTIPRAMYYIHIYYVCWDERKIKIKTYLFACFKLEIKDNYAALVRVPSTTTPIDLRSSFIIVLVAQKKLTRHGASIVSFNLKLYFYLFIRYILPDNCMHAFKHLYIVCVFTRTLRF